MFRFTIRELVLVTTVVALAVGWWADHYRLARRSWIMVSTGVVTAGLRPGEKLELEILPSGGVGKRIIRAK